MKAPKSVLKGIFRKHASQVRLSKNTELLLYMDFLTYMKKLAMATRQEAVSANEKIVSRDSVRAAAKSIKM
jgi:hypothetical protein